MWNATDPDSLAKRGGFLIKREEPMQLENWADEKADLNGTDKMWVKS